MHVRTVLPMKYFCNPLELTDPLHEGLESLSDISYPRSSGIRWEICMREKLQECLSEIHRIIATCLITKDRIEDTHPTIRFRIHRI